MPGKGENLEEMTVKELHEMATDLHVSGSSGMSKNELIQAIREHQKSQGGKRPR